MLARRLLQLQPHVTRGNGNLDGMCIITPTCRHLGIRFQAICDTPSTPSIHNEKHCLHPSPAVMQLLIWSQLQTVYSTLIGIVLLGQGP